MVNFSILLSFGGISILFIHCVMLYIVISPLEVIITILD